MSQQSKLLKVATGCVVGIMIGAFTFICMQYITKLICFRVPGIDNAYTRFMLAALEDQSPWYEAPDRGVTRTHIPWDELYPFPDAYTTAPTEGAPEANSLQQLSAWQFVEDIKNLLEKYSNDYLPGRTFLLETSARYEKALGWYLDGDGVENRIYQLEPGYFVASQENQPLDYQLSGLIGLNEFLQRNETPFLYVQLPGKVCREDLINGALDFTNVATDELLRRLSSTQAPVLDLRDSIHQQRLDHHSLFFSADNHWKPETTLWANGVIVNQINGLYSPLIDPMAVDPDNYSFDMLPDSFLGGIGRVITTSKVQADDFAVLRPHFETNLSISIPSLSLKATGDYTIMYSDYQLNNHALYDNGLYAAYLYGNNALTRIHNTDSDNETRLLVIKDSFGCLSVPSLALGCKYTDVIDLRSFTGSLQQFILDTAPDVVLVMYCPNVVLAYNEENMQAWNFD